RSSRCTGASRTRSTRTTRRCSAITPRAARLTAVFGSSSDPRTQYVDRAIVVPPTYGGATVRDDATKRESGERRTDRESGAAPATVKQRATAISPLEVSGKAAAATEL